ncbi:uncharacterized protein MCYG_07888 [Microsporum canis CBS 113480]|uniref:Uncharacterized protein n=1 Tax=Arthroderma otae (strain ATCC MYA-4605 / CBS 113480) TaxID=554155 RepID=C5FXM9_ARTOC|nr:uncharacterized protein MCYG_07888 [Microsporum canis CBS 113480]EEQ35069.1 predicted protein [Microsporum canis CBS 113480]
MAKRPSHSVTHGGGRLFFFLFAHWGLSDPPSRRDQPYIVSLYPTEKRNRHADWNCETVLARKRGDFVSEVGAAFLPGLRLLTKASSVLWRITSRIDGHGMQDSVLISLHSVPRALVDVPDPSTRVGSSSCLWPIRDEAEG